MMSTIQKDAHQQNAKDLKENTQVLAGGFIQVKVSCQVFCFLFIILCIKFLNDHVLFRFLKNIPISTRDYQHDDELLEAAS